MRIPLLHRLPRTPAIVIGTAVVTAGLVGATSAVAAVHYVVLGAKNYSTAPTTINNSKGTPLALNSKTGYAPLAVGSNKLVTKLNADYLDGLHASSFARSTGKTGIIYAADKGAVCPAGTIATGGGGALFHYDVTAPNDESKYVYDIPINYSGPDINATTGALISNSWVVLPADGTTHYGIDAYVVCYNPNGAVPGAVTASTATTTAAKAVAKVKVAARR
jgi:hypothetical protein